MTTFEIITVATSVLALLISTITAYQTLLSRFTGEIFIRPYVLLTRWRGSPSMVVGFEITNTGAKSGLLNDVILLLNYQQGNSRNKYSFFPTLVRENYNIFEQYQESDFEPFQAIPVSANSRLTRYIMFLPSQPGFSPATGEIEIEVFKRELGEEFISSGKVRLVISDDDASSWRDPLGESIMKETTENNKYRERLMNQEFR